MRTLVRFLVLALLAGCAPDLTSSGSGGQMSIALPAFDISGLAAQNGDEQDPRFRVTRGRVRIFVVGNPNAILDRAFNPDDLGDDDEGRLEVTFPIPTGSENATYEFLVEVFNASNERLYAVGPANFTVASAGGGATVTATAEYVGPGIGVTAVSIEPTSLTLSAGETSALRCIGTLGANGGTTESFPKSFDSDNSNVAFVDGLGRLTANGPGVTLVRCTQDVPPYAAASIQVTVRDRASNIVIEGGGQSSFTGTALPQPIRVLVTGVNGAPISGATVRFTPNATSGSASPATATTEGDGRTQTIWTLGSTTGAQSMTVSVDGIAGQRTVNATATTAPPGGIQGVVRSATTGDPITVQASVVVRAGAGVTSGTILNTVTSSPTTGGFTVTGLAPGPYTLVTTASGFASGQTTVQVGPGPQNTVANVVLSPNAPPGNVRIVLTWGDTPADLDALLQLPSGTVIGYFNLGNCSATPFACLDVDDTDGRGPETITIAQTLPGTYIFAVDNFTAFGAPATDRTLSNSGAVVEVYNGNTRVATFPVPPNRAGLQWQVFSYSQGVITPLNTFSAGTAGSALRLGERASKGR